MSDAPDIKIETRDLDLHYGQFHALRNVNLRIKPKMTTAIIGPSGCGKSTLLRCFNRMNELIKGVRIGGEIRLDGTNIYGSGVNLSRLRRRVGMVFQRPNPFPLSVEDNVAYGLRVHGLTDRSKIEETVERSLQATGLWDDVKDKLRSSALSLTPEQQQRLCISRVVAVKPEVLLMDEPCSALDPIATGHIEELMWNLCESYTIVIVTHNMQQAARVATETAFMLLGDLVEFGPTVQIFENPKDKRTEDYVSGHYG
ncbi:MAG: phosphate ABC transporter ATP-binding protein [Candidatus Hydrogenedentes bacterium]|nr:phosphate ABC transporter ATP-binding protein [Candidatus Hydrogenedentota bacterium]